LVSNHLLPQAGYTTLSAVARADPLQLAAAVEHLSGKAARLMVQAAQLLLIEKSEALHEEADEVLLDLSV
jgi:POLQ-like helicase